MKGTALKSLVLALAICLASLAGIPAAAASGSMYVNVFYPDNRIFTMNLDGTGVVSLGDLNGTLDGPAGMAIDSVHGTIYFPNFFGNTVTRANLDGTGAVNLGNLGGLLDYPNDMALDVAAGKMYVASERYGGYGAIIRANLDGTGAVNLGSFNGLLNWATGIALDTARGEMYIASYRSNCIVKANLDGTDAVRLAGLDGFLDSPHSIALDTVNGKLYVTSFGWYDPSKATVVRVNLDGTGAENLGSLNGFLGYPINIALDVNAGKMYVTCTTREYKADVNRLVQANLDGTGAVDLGNLGGAGPMHVALLLDNSPVVPPVAPPDVAFSKLSASATVKGNAFSSKGYFVLGADNDGILPLTEDIGFGLGDYSFTLPAGSLMEIMPGHYIYSRVLDGVTLSVQITACRGGKYKFKVTGSGATNLPYINPVSLRLKIGDDSGTLTRTCRIKTN